MPKVTLYQKLRTAKKKYCEGKIDKTAFNSAASSYKTDAVKKGKTATEAAAIVKRVETAACSTAISGTKRKKRATKKK